MSEIGGAITRNGLLLAAFAIATALLVASVFLGTRDRIEEAQRAAEEKALLEIVPRSLHDNTMLDDILPTSTNAPLLGLSDQRSIYVARRGTDATAVVIPAIAPDGYSGDIELIVGVMRNGSVAGVRVLQHRETPGLGDAIDHRKSPWIESLRGRSLSDPAAGQWTVKKDGGAFDQFTGATITPRAVVKATARVLEYVERNRAKLFPDLYPDSYSETEQSGETQQ